MLSIDDLLLLLNHHWARDTSTFPTERYRVQYPLLLLLLSGTGCRPAELVDARRRRKDDISADNGEVVAQDKSSHDSGAVTDKDFTGHDGYAQVDFDLDTSGVEEDVRRVDAICYEDVRLLVVRSPDSRGRDVLAMEVTMTHHKGHKRRPKP